MSLGQFVKAGWLQSGGAIPARKFLRPAALAHHKGYSLLAKSIPAYRMDTSKPCSSSVRKKVISTYRSS